MAETRHNEPHDPRGNPQGLDFDGPSGPARNRQAAGAREAQSPQAADSGWQAGAGATDFLGLEPDLRGDAGADGSSGPTESWLFDIEQSDAGLAPSPTGFAPGRASAATAVETDEDESASSGFGARDDDFDGASAGDSPDSFESDEFPEAPASPAATPGRRGPSRVLVGTVLLAVLAVGGWYGWTRYEHKLRPYLSRLPGLEVATTPTSPLPKPKPDAGTPKPVIDPAAPTHRGPRAQPGGTPAPTAVEPTTPDTTTVEVVPGPAIDPTGTETAQTTVAVEPAAISHPAIPTEVAPTPPIETALTRSANPSTREPELPTGRPGPGGGRHATELDWAGMWLDPTIPVDAIHGPTRLRTLNVGLVRAELVNGEFIEGRLQAVGESRIWLDVKMGRIAFDASEVRHLAQIVGAQGMPLPLGTQALAGLPNVEILLPGGSLTGRVLARDGDRVTFVTEDGMRMRVEALDVRPAPNGRSRLIGPAAARQP